tara:strand:+ start:1157 stop:3748 length:2592 start_codon:yes stop_codon:yes gene_type:complete
MSTLRVDKIKGRTGTTVTIPDSQNLTVTGGLTVSGTQTFASGSSLSLQGENINSGSRGDILYYDSTGKIAKLNIGSVGQVLKSDGTDVSWNAIGNAANVYYVTTNGTDAQGRGASIDTAWKTIKYACSNIGTPTINQPAVIFVKGGVYEETALPIVVPPYTTIVGDSLRATTVKPASGLDSGGSILNNRSTLFRLSNGTIIQDLLLDGMGGYVPGSPSHAPEAATIGGVYFALNAASPITEKSPYIYNITSFGDGATGALIDGALHGSGNKSMLFHTYTTIHSDGLSIWAKDNGAAEIICGFTYYCQIGYAATGGGVIRSLNSSNSYGEYGVYAAGFNTSETANSGTVKGKMLTYTNVLTGTIAVGATITGQTSGATAYVISVQAEPKTMYIIPASGTFQAGEVVSDGSTSATLDSGGSFIANQDGRILVTTFAQSAPDPGDSLQFATTDGNAYQIQTVSAVTVNSVDYQIIVFSTSRPTPVAENVTVQVRKEFSLVRLTGHDFLMIGTGDATTTNWPNEPTQPASQADQIITNTTDPGRVYYVATDEMGNFYVGDQFKVDQATGKVTLDSSAFDLKGLESLQLGSVGGLIGAQVNEFSTDATFSQNSNVKVPTQQAVKTYVDNLSSLAGNLTIAGNLTVNGTTTSVNTTNTNISDKLIELGNGTTGSPTGDIGLIFERGSSTNIFIGYDESEDQIAFKTTTATGASTGNLTFNSNANVVLGNIITDRIITNEVVERVTTWNPGPTGTVNLNLADKALFNYTGNSSGNFTFNARADNSTALSSMLAVNECLTLAIVVQNGGTAYYNNGFQIDGVDNWSNVKWPAGTAPTQGTASGLDVYTFSIFRTGAGTTDYRIIANVTGYS